MERTIVDSWSTQLPLEYQSLVDIPVVFERHTEPSVSAEKIIGFDAHGVRCYYSHTFMLSVEGFDVDEFPILIDAYFERVVAWRLHQGRWVSIKSFSDQMDHCNKRMTTLPVELTDSAPR